MVMQTTPLTWGSYVSQIATLAVVQTSDSNYQNIIPQMINYAELRMQRDLDFLSTQISDTSYSLTSGNQTLVLPTASFITIQTISVNDGSGNVTPLLPVSKEFLQNVYATSSGSGVPQYFAVYGGDAATGGLTSQNIIVGPWPNSNYNVTITGTAHAPPLGYLPSTSSVTAGGITGTIVFSSAHGLSTGNLITLIGFAPTGWNATYSVTFVNTTTVTITLASSYGNPTTTGTIAATNDTSFISTYLPDVMIMASMIYISAYQRNFGRINDDPQMAQTYESQYQALLRGAGIEEARKKFQAGAWTAYSPATVASPTRG